MNTTTLGAVNKVVQSLLRNVPVMDIGYAVNEVIRTINRSFPGLETLETAFEMKVTKTEPLTFNNANPATIVTTSNISSYITAGADPVYDYALISGSTLNDGIYKIASVLATTITLVASEALSTETSTCTISILHPSNNYTMPTPWEISYPTAVKRLIRVYKNDVELTARGYEYVQDSGNTTDHVYASKGRYGFILPSGMLVTDGDKIKTLVDKVIGTISTFTTSTTITIPAELEGLLEDGVKYHLFQRPEWRNEVLLNEYKEKFLIGMKELAAWESGRTPYANFTPDFQYGRGGGNGA